MAPMPTDEISTVSALPDQIHGLRRAPLHAGTTHAAAAAPSSTGSAADVLPWLAGTHRRIMMCLPLRRVEVVPLPLPHLIVPSACRPASAHILQGWGMWSSRCPYRLSSSWSEFLATSLSTSLRSNHLLQTTWFSSKSAKKTLRGLALHWLQCQFHGILILRLNANISVWMFRYSGYRFDIEVECQILFGWSNR